MRLAVDASTLVAESLRVRGRRLLAHPILDLIVAAEAWDETQHEIQQRVEVLIDRRALEPSLATTLRDQALDAVAACVSMVPISVYADRVDEARQRIPRDARDAPTVALALAMDCGIWTADRDFFGCGLPVWTTESLLRYVEWVNRA
jgi:predicted nucleic acid-binding protein